MEQDTSAGVVRYKVTGPAGESVHGGEWRYDLPTRHEDGSWTPGAWTPRQSPERCSSGWHLTTEPMYWPVVGMRVWEAEPRGKSDEGDGKSAHERIRLLREVPELVPAWWHDVEAFVASINAVPWFQPQRDPDPDWRVFATWDDASNAVLQATGRTPWDAAWSDARTAVQRVAVDGGRGAALDVARGAAWGMVYNPAGTLPAAAGREATLLASALVCGGLPLEPRHLTHARDRWAVWTAGYGLLGDAHDTLYVYRSPS